MTIPRSPATWWSFMPFAPRAVLIFGLMPLAACALSPYDEDGVTKRAATLARVATPTVETQPFVRESRQGETRYLAVGVTPPKRELQPRSAAQAEQLAAELDAERKRSEEFARRAAPPPTYDGTIPPRVQPPPKELTPQ